MEIKGYKLPNMEHKFSILVTGEESGYTFSGDFKYRRPTLRERAMIDVMRARYNGDLNSLDGDVQALNECLAHLRFTLIESPDWWKELGHGDKLYDANVILEIYNKCMEFEAEWRTKTHGKPEDIKPEAQVAT